MTAAQTEATKKKPRARKKRKPSGVMRVVEVASIFDEMNQMEERIMRRAYDLFECNGRSSGADILHWLEAEREITWKPEAELREKDDVFLLSVALAGMDPTDVRIKATADHILIRGDERHDHDSEKGKVHFCEFQAGNLFRCVRFPKRIDPYKAKARFSNGLLRIEVPAAEIQERTEKS